MGDKQNLLGGNGLVWLIVFVIVIAVVIVLVLGKRSDNENGEGSPQDRSDDNKEKWWLIGLAIAAGVVIVLWYTGAFGMLSGDNGIVKIEKEGREERRSPTVRSAQSARGPRSQSPLSARSPARGSLKSLSPESGAE
jgi:H+/Cl- antiporter ClcA